MLAPGLKAVNKRERYNVLPEPDPTRKHLFVLNYTDQTVSVIDTSTDTVESTINLPSTGTEGSNWQFQSMIYRSKNDTVYIFGLNRIVLINADPNSPNFKQVTNLSGTVNASSLFGSGTGSVWIGAEYNYHDDTAYLTLSGNNGIFVWNFLTTTLISYGDEYNYMPGYKVFFLQKNKFCTSGQWGVNIWKNGKRQIFIPGSSLIDIRTSVCYVKKLDGIYHGAGGFAFMDLKTNLRSLQITSTGGSSSYAQMIDNPCYSPDYDLVMASRKETDATCFVVDVSTNTLLGTFTRVNRDANETIAKDIVYSAYSKKFYMQGNCSTAASAVNRVYVFDMSTYVANGKVDLNDIVQSYITCGNMTFATNPLKYVRTSMVMNHIRPC